MFDSTNITAASALVVREVVDSTQNIAAQLARDGAPHMTCIIAEEQTAGRGRMGRVWQTFPHHSLACSVILRDMPAQLPLLAALAIADSIEEFCDLRPAIKWPNDLLLAEKKVCGILVESYPMPANNERFHVLGFGLNVNTPKQMPADLPLTTLQAHTGQALPREALLNIILSNLHEGSLRLKEEGFAPFLTSYRQRCMSFGQRVRWQHNGQEQHGTAVDIAADGTLIIETTSGRVNCPSADIIMEGSSS